MFRTKKEENEQEKCEWKLFDFILVKICIILITRVCLSRKRRKPTHIRFHNRDCPETKNAVVEPVVEKIVVAVGIVAVVVDFLDNFVVDELR